MRTTPTLKFSAGAARAHNLQELASSLVRRTAASPSPRCSDDGRVSTWPETLGCATPCPTSRGGGGSMRAPRRGRADGAQAADVHFSMHVFDLPGAQPLAGRMAAAETAAPVVGTYAANNLHGGSSRVVAAKVAELPALQTGCAAFLGGALSLGPSLAALTGRR